MEKFSVARREGKEEGEEEERKREREKIEEEGRKDRQEIKPWAQSRDLSWLSAQSIHMRNWPRVPQYPHERLEVEALL